VADVARCNITKIVLTFRDLIYFKPLLYYKLQGGARCKFVLDNSIVKLSVSVEDT